MSVRGFTLRVIALLVMMIALTIVTFARGTILLGLVMVTVTAAATILGSRAVGRRFRTARAKRRLGAQLSDGATPARIIELTTMVRVDEYKGADRDG